MRVNGWMSDEGYRWIGKEGRDGREVEGWRGGGGKGGGEECGGRWRG